MPITVEQTFEDRLFSFTSLVTERTEVQLLGNLFREACPSGELSKKFSQQAFKHLIEIQYPFERLMLLLLDPLVNITGSGNPARLLRMLNTTSAKKTDKILISDLKGRYEALFSTIAKLNMPDSQQNLPDSEVMNIIYTLKAASPNVFSDIERTQHFKSLWQSCLMRQNVVAPKLFDAQLFQQVTRTLQCHYGPAVLFWMKANQEPLVEDLVGLLIWSTKSKHAGRKRYNILLALGAIPPSLMPSVIRAVTASLALHPQPHLRALYLDSWLRTMSAFSETQILEQPCLAAEIPTSAEEEKATQSPPEQFASDGADSESTAENRAIEEPPAQPSVERKSKPEEESQNFRDLVYKEAINNNTRPVDLLHYLDTYDLKTILHFYIMDIAPDVSLRTKLTACADNYLESSTTSGARKLGEALAQILVEMEDVGVPISTVDKAIELVYRQPGGGANATYNFLSEISFRTQFDFNPQILYRFVLETMYTDSAHAYKLYNLVASLDKRYNPDFPVNYILDGLRSLMEMSNMVLSARSRDHLPTPYRKVPLVHLYQIRVELIHQIAYQYALDDRLSLRSSRRAVYYLWKYLVKYKLPMGPLMTKAMVKVNITRPMLDRQWVATRRFLIIRKAVARVEGKETADNLHAVFWQWRGELIRDAKRRHLEAGGLGPARVSVVRKLGI
jgi:hypothetical protein